MFIWMQNLLNFNCHTRKCHNCHHTNEGKEERYMSEIFQYKIGTGWINLGNIPPLDAEDQFGIYMLKEPGLKALDSLKCNSE